MILRRGIVFLLLLLPMNGLATPEFDISWSHRMISENGFDSGVIEGGIGVTISSENRAYLVEPVEGLEYLGNNIWEYIFPWDWTSPLEASFHDYTSDTTVVSLAPALTVPFDPASHDLPVINISTAPANLWDPESGIYVFGDDLNCCQVGEDWERPAAFQWYEGSNVPVFTEQIGLRIHGAYSRNFGQKGLRFYFDDYGSSDEVEYDFFGNSPMSFRRLIIRTGHYPLHCINSVLLEGMFIDLGNLGSRSRDVAVYLNREYWGFYTLRERIDKEFIEYTHDLASAGYDFIKDGTTEHGDGSSWWSFFNSFQEDLEFSTHQWYVEACGKLDMVSYIDWQLLNIFGASADNNGAWNLDLLRLGSGPWQFVMWDEDMTFKADNLPANFFRFRSITTLAELVEFKPEELYTADINVLLQWGRMFARLMENSEFKDLFRQRYELMACSVLSEEGLLTRLNNLQISQATEMDRHADRWWWDSGSVYLSHINYLESWISQRLAINHDHYLDFIEHHRHPLEMVALSGFQDPGGVHLSWQTASEDSVAGFNVYRGSQDDDLQLIASCDLADDLLATGGVWIPASYAYVDTTSDLQLPLYYKLSWQNHLDEEVEIDWVVEITEPLQMPSLVINEYLALNSHGIVDETGACEDWCELFNSGSDPVQLEGMYLTDDLNTPTKWVFPDVILGPGEFLLIWCDSDPEDGPLHTNFKLSGSGESLGLFNSQPNGNGLIHSRIFSVQVSDVSEGSCIDGGAELCSFNTPTPEFSNNDTSAVPDISGVLIGWVSCVPNPFNPTTEIRFTLQAETQISITVFDLYGRIVQPLLSGNILSSGTHSVTWNGKDETGKCVSSGTYLVQVATKEYTETVKAVLLK